jgi:hypothetical protein
MRAAEAAWRVLGDGWEMGEGKKEKELTTVSGGLDISTSWNAGHLTAPQQP